MCVYFYMHSSFILLLEYYAFDGCSHNSDDDFDMRFEDPGYFQQERQVAAVACCTKVKGNRPISCKRYNKNGDCWSGKGDDLKMMSWDEAYAACDSEGLRLCEDQGEIDLCCGRGCDYDNALVWSQKTSGRE